MAPKEVLNFGLVIFPGFQWLDAAGPVDFINNQSYDMLKSFNFPQSLVDKAPIIKWHYIGPNLEPIHPTSGPPHLPTTTYDDCPTLDYLLIPGGDPFKPAPKDFVAFVQKRFADPKLKALLTICTASIWVAESGILDGRHVCSAKVALKMLAEAGTLYKKVKWVGDRRWAIDGKIWSSAGITAGLDLASEFSKVHFDEEVWKQGLDNGEYKPNPAQPDPFARILDGVEI